MNASSILDQLLKSGQGTGQDGSEQSKNANSPLGGLGDLLSGSGLGGMLSGFGGGALAGGALGLLLGNKKPVRLVQKWQWLAAWVRLV